MSDMLTQILALQEKLSSDLNDINRLILRVKEDMEKKPTYGIFLGCHDRLGELIPNLDVCKWTGYPTYVLLSNRITWDHPEPVRYIDVPAGKTSNQGAGWHMMKALEWANELGIDKMLYNNGDDWVLRRTVIHNAFATSSHLTAYNWLGSGYDGDFATNVNVFDVKWWCDPYVIPKSGKTRLQEGFSHFSNLNNSVEHNFANWVRFCDAKWERLPNRECGGGIGHFIDDPDEWDTSRWFSRHWQLLGHHNQCRRWQRYQQLKGKYGGIEGVEELEAMPRFRRWMDTCEEVWGIPQY
jgi:hypothetical protein